MVTACVSVSIAEAIRSSPGSRRVRSRAVARTERNMTAVREQNACRQGATRAELKLRTTNAPHPAPVRRSAELQLRVAGADYPAPDLYFSPLPAD